MAYSSGSCVDLAAIVSFIRAACTANGWTLSGNVLWKGNTYVEIVTDATGVRIKGGTGKDGSNNLTGAGPRPAYLRTIAGQALVFPVNIEVHINTAPDEVFVVINFASSFYEMLAWGISDAPGLTGTGVWYYGSGSERNVGYQGFYAEVAGANYGSSNAEGPQHAAMFNVNSEGNGSYSGSFIHCDIDGTAWAGTGAQMAYAYLTIHPLVAATPSAWNNETVLLPYQVYTTRPSNKMTLIADLKHIRIVRIDFHNPADIITLGPDRWKLFPWFKKDATALGGARGQAHSGTMGYALRYTGP